MKVSFILQVLTEFFRCAKLKAINSFVFQDYNKFKYKEILYNVKKTVFEVWSY
jgi:ABC-type polar amino acid transport system ATPase subunit